MLDIVAHGGIGDVIMCTPALRELKRRNPRAHLRFYSSFSSLVRGLPYIDQALPYDTRPSPATYMDYSDETDFVALPKAPLVSLLGDTLGLPIHDTRMDCVIDPALVESATGPPGSTCRARIWPWCAAPTASGPPTRTGPTPPGTS